MESRSTEIALVRVKLEKVVGTLDLKRVSTNYCASPSRCWTRVSTTPGHWLRSKWIVFFYVDEAAQSLRIREILSRCFKKRLKVEQLWSFQVHQSLCVRNIFRYTRLKIIVFVKSLSVPFIGCSEDGQNGAWGRVGWCCLNPTRQLLSPHATAGRILTGVEAVGFHDGKTIGLLVVHKPLGLLEGRC